MPDSDDEYVQDASDDDIGAFQVTRDTEKAKAIQASKSRKDERDFEVTRTWENVVEGEDGTISSAVEGMMDAGKRQRLLKDTTPLQRGIIRHLILVIDCSFSMAEKDLLPTRYLLTLRYAQEFVHEFFEQNPISQLGIVGMRDGLAVRVSDMSGNPNDHISSLQALRPQEPMGDASLQNALEMARGALFHAPSHGTREVLLVFGSLLTSDPGDIHQTITALVGSHIACSVIGLAAQIAICATLVKRTNPGVNPQDLYGVALGEQHFHDLFMRATTPPITPGASLTTPSAGPNGSAEDMDPDPSNKSTLLMMGFPSRIATTHASLCACHSRPTRGGYLCSRCSSKVCALPATCPACGLTLILSTHLARSYHHLFPLRNWAEVSWPRALRKRSQVACFGCMLPFPEIPARELARPRKGGGGAGAGTAAMGRMKEGGVSESGRYECRTCGTFFCIDCDVFAHEVVHNCPGCQSLEGEPAAQAVDGQGGGEEGGGEGMDGVLHEPAADEEAADARRRRKGKGREVVVNGR